MPLRSKLAQYRYDFAGAFGQARRQLECGTDATGLRCFTILAWMRLVWAARRGPDALIFYGMVLGMATTKITITIDDAQIEEIRALVAAGQAASVSGFVKHAIGIALFDAAGWREMLGDALQQTGGPLTRKERTWADAILSPTKHSRTRRRGKAA